MQRHKESQLNEVLLNREPEMTLELWNGPSKRDIGKLVVLRRAGWVCSWATSWTAESVCSQVLLGSTRFDIVVI